MVSAALRSVLGQWKASEIEPRWDELASCLEVRFHNTIKRKPRQEKSISPSETSKRRTEEGMEHQPDRASQR